MLLRTVLLLLLAFGSHAGLAAEPAPADAAAATGDEAATDADTTASQEEDAAGDDAAANEGAEVAATEEAAGSLDGEGFVPSVQISEDLSVSFPTDI